MARPKSEDPKEAVTLRLRRSTLARIAKRAGKTTPGTWLSGHVETLFGDHDATNAPNACPHPKDQESRFSWGTLCGVCGKRLR